MYIATIPNRNSPPAILLREGYRENGKVKNRTLANLSKLPPEAIEAVRRVLKGEKLVPSDELFEIVENGSSAHGHVEAIFTAMRRLGLPSLLSARRSRERDLVVAMIAARLLKPQSKLATTRWWSSTTLPDMLNIADADSDELYKAMDWLLERQSRIEKKLAARHLEEGGLALYDLSSSYFEGVTCPLAALGHNRDGKKGKLQVNYGLLTNKEGIPTAISVFKGNSGDPKTLLPQVEKMRVQFGIGNFTLVGDRGMITQKQVEVLREIEGIDWISALRPGAIRKLVEGEVIQMGLFDERNLFEFRHPDWPGERLVACRNPPLAARRKAKREALLEATIKELDQVRKMVARGRIYGREAINDRVQKTLKGYRVGRYFTVTIHKAGFDYSIDESAISAMAAKGAEHAPDVVATRLQRYQRHVESITTKFDRLQRSIVGGQLYGKDNIGVRVGKVINKYKVAKHFILRIQDDSFDFEIDQDRIDAEAALDGMYVIRTSVESGAMDSEETVRNYKQLSVVERAFRCFKSVDLMIRPIRHRIENRVRAHIFLCMLAYYVQWHMIDVWRPLLFADEDQQAKTSRDPVAPAKRSAHAMKKVAEKHLEDGTHVHSFRTLLSHLGEIVRNTCRCPAGGPNAPTFFKTTSPNPKQRQALELLTNIKM